MIARIDTMEAVHNFEGILKHADGVVLLRKNLAMEMEADKLVIA